FSEGRALVRQDGRACALHDGGRAVLPGRFKGGKPAAVARHTTLALRCDAPPSGVLPADPTNEPAFLPAPAALRASWLWAARGSVDCHSLPRVQDAGGFVLSRAKAGRKPHVVEALRAAGNRRCALRPKPRKAVHAKRPQRQRVERV